MKHNYLLNGHFNVILEKKEEVDVNKLDNKVDVLERELCILKDLITNLLDKN